MTPSSPSFLLGIDLEDVRLQVTDGLRYRERVPAMTERLLEFLERHAARVTFFVVGDVARRYPDLLARIVRAGHELAWHTDEHVPLDRHTPATLRDDLRRGRDLLAKLSDQPLRGFRAPIHSLTQSSAWAYDVLAEEGFTYSSSVMPVRHPFYGWPEFGEQPRRMGAVWELPLSVLPLPGARLAFLSGIYLRVLPRWMIGAVSRSRRASGVPLVGYVHPHDLDVDQERFRQAGTEGSLLLHFLMYYNRGSVLPKLEMLVAQGHHLRTCTEYVRQLAE